MLAWRHLITVAFVLLGLGLTLPIRAQFLSLQELAHVTEGANNGKPVVFDPDKPVPVIIADAVNHSAITFDGMERAFTDKLAEELTSTKAFAPVDRTTAETLVKELGMIPPYSIASQVLLAKELQCAYVITSTIDSAKIVQSRGSTCAEVQVTTVVVSRVIQEQQTRAQVIVRSSLQAGHLASDVLVHEALDNADYEITQRLLTMRIPFATVLTGCTMSDEMILRGGSQIGIKKGMILITVRRRQPTGKMKVFRVKPAESYANILEDSKGIAPGDKAIPARYEPPTRSGHPRAGLLALLAFGVLVALAGSR